MDYVELNLNFFIRQHKKELLDSDIKGKFEILTNEMTVTQNSVGLNRYRDLIFPCTITGIRLLHLSFHG